MKRILLTLATALLLCPAALRADEGMWLLPLLDSYFFSILSYFFLDFLVLPFFDFLLFLLFLAFLAFLLTFSDLSAFADLII